MSRARHSPAPRAGDRLIRTGALVFAAGLVAVAVVFVPFTLDLVRHGARYAQRRGAHERGIGLSLATFLTCLGLGLGLFGMVRQARKSISRHE